MPNADVGDLHLDQVLRSHDVVSKSDSIVSALLLVLAGFFFAVMCVVAVFYLLDSLHSDRKDRSVLFWKSLPVSDTTTVLSKLATAAVAIPLWTWVATIAASILFALVLNTRLSFATSVNLWPLIWDPRPWFSVQVLLLWSIVAGVLWYLPVMGYLLLVSSWAKRAVMLWAALPPLMLMFVEEMVFDTSRVGAMLGYRFGGWLEHAFGSPADIPHDVVMFENEGVPFPAQLTDVPTVGAYFSNIDLWIGIAVAAAFIWGAVLVRRHRTEI